jgi:nicotinate-nucleotide adenylyltransferase
MKMIAIFGGTFDPIHTGHMRGLIEAREIINFERVFLVPAGTPPHKTHQVRSPREDRLEMVRLAIVDLGFGEVSTFEIDSSEPSFTLNTVSHFRETFKDLAPTLIIGSDSLLEINTWHRYEDVLSLANLAVLPRPGFIKGDNIEELGKKLSPVKIEEIKRNFPTSASDWITTDKKRAIILLKINRLNISSTNIRGKVNNGRSIKFLVTESIEKYIIEKGLYREV